MARPARTDPLYQPTEVEMKMIDLAVSDALGWVKRRNPNKGRSFFGDPMIDEEDLSSYAKWSIIRYWDTLLKGMKSDTGRHKFDTNTLMQMRMFHYAKKGMLTLGGIGKVSVNEKGAIRNNNIATRRYKLMVKSRMGSELHLFDKVGDKEYDERDYETWEFAINCLVTLHEPYKSIMIMRFYDNMNLTEIAKKIKRSRERARQLIAEAIRMIREKLQKEGFEFPSEKIRSKYFGHKALKTF
jgi:RNA polymerase sigma factor (sigma-70 family)